MSSSSMEPQYLKGLVVFRHFVDTEKIRTVHFYESEGGLKDIEEREFMFHKDFPYEEIKCFSALTMYGDFKLSEQKEGCLNSVWICIFVFDVDRGLPSSAINIPTILEISSNEKLKAIPRLADDLKAIFDIIEWEELEQKGQRGMSQDLNLPHSEKETIGSDSQPSL